MNLPKPGIHPNVPFAQYLKWPVPSYSTIKHGRAPGGSMKRMKAAMDRELDKPPSDLMVLGSCLHTSFLEPELAASRTALWEGTRRGKEWEAFKAANASKAILTTGMHDAMVGMVRAIRAHPWVRENIGYATQTEVSALGTIRDTLVRGRADLLTDDMIVDVKKVRGVDRRTITNTVLSMGYHIQGAMYRRLFGLPSFVLIVVEDKPPFDVVPYELQDDILDHGESVVNEVLDQYKFSLKSGVWPGQSDDLLPLNAPEWMNDADKAAAITIGGESAFGEDE